MPTEEQTHYNIWAPLKAGEYHTRQAQKLTISNRLLNSLSFMMQRLDPLTVCQVTSYTGSKSGELVTVPYCGVLLLKGVLASPRLLPG